MIGTSREGTCECGCVQRPEWDGGHVSTSAWEGQAGSVHVTADTCICQACSASVSAPAFRGTIVAVGTEMPIPADDLRQWACDAGAIRLQEGSDPVSVASNMTGGGQ